MIFYELPLDMKKLVLSYNLGDVRLLKIQSKILLKIILINLNQCTSLTKYILCNILKLIKSISIMEYHIYLT